MTNDESIKLPLVTPKRKVATKTGHALETPVGQLSSVSRTVYMQNFQFPQFAKQQVQVTIPLNLKKCTDFTAKTPNLDKITVPYSRYLSPQETKRVSKPDWSAVKAKTGFKIRCDSQQQDQSSTCDQSKMQLYH